MRVLFALNEYSKRCYCENCIELLIIMIGIILWKKN